MDLALVPRACDVGVPMRVAVAFTLIILGIACLALAAASPVWEPAFTPTAAALTGQPEWFSFAVMGGSVLGFVFVTVGVVILWRGGGPSERWRPYIDAIDRLAAEHGQHVEVDKKTGLEFVAVRDGQRILVRLKPEPEHSLSIKGIVAGRQTLTFIRPERAPPEDHRSQIVGGGKGWQLRAELPAIARVMLNDVVMISMMDRFFAHADTLGIRHDVSGIEVLSELPAPDQVERRTRQAIDIVSYLRRVNG